MEINPLLKRPHYCLVPGCSSNSRKTPEKKFYSLPKNKDRRKAWLRAIRRDPAKFSASGAGMVCQDHFTLEEDLENFVWYKYYGIKRAILKREVVPHVFECQPDRKTAQKPNPRSTSARRARKTLVGELCVRSESETHVLDSTRNNTTDQAIQTPDSIQKWDAQTTSKGDVPTTSRVSISKSVNNMNLMEIGGCYIVTTTTSSHSETTEFLSPRKFMGLSGLLHSSMGYKNVGTQTIFEAPVDKSISAVPKTAESSTNCNFDVLPPINISTQTIDIGLSPFS